MSKHAKALASGIGIAFLYLLFLSTVEFSKQYLKNQKLIEQRAQQLFEEELRDAQKVTFPDYFSALTMTGFLVVENRGKYEENENKVGVFEDAFQLSGAKLERGYLLVDVVVDGNKPLTVYDSFYFGFVKGWEFAGGHLMRDRSLGIPPKSGENNSTVLLFSLNSLPYLKDLPYDENRPYKTADLLSEINTGKKIVLKGFLSTARSAGKIKSVKIFYDCGETKNCILR